MAGLGTRQPLLPPQSRIEMPAASLTCGIFLTKCCQKGGFTGLPRQRSSRVLSVLPSVPTPSLGWASPLRPALLGPALPCTLHLHPQSRGGVGGNDPPVRCPSSARSRFPSSRSCSFSRRSRRIFLAASLSFLWSRGTDRTCRGCVPWSSVPAGPPSAGTCEQTHMAETIR